MLKPETYSVAMSPGPNCKEFIRISNRNSLSDEEKKKLDTFSKTFREKTKTDVKYIIRTPGRVNLIGDHIDYHGFAVLPMAIENCIWLGCSFTNGCQEGDSAIRIRIINNDSATHPPFICEHSLKYGSELNKSHRWYHYILCGYHGVLANNLLKIEPNDIFRHANQVLSDDKQLSQVNEKLKNLTDFNIFVDSDLPPASGLSSSSALVCASAIATCLLLNESQNDTDCSKSIDLEIDCKSMAESCSKFEHLIGTHGGGMDQAVIMTAQDGYAKYVEFTPEFNCENVRLPKDVIWLISHCGSSYPKAATSGFNSRVFETKLAAAMIAKVCGDNKIKLDHTITLGHVKQEIFSGVPACEIIEILKNKVFEKNEFSIDEISARLEISQEELIERFETNESFLKENFNDKIQLLVRCEHVFEEAERVNKFKSICDTTCDVHLLGELMTQSHYSLRNKYQCSHPALDNLVDVAIKAGALGARLTGAGWGGCIVTMVETANCDYVTERLKAVSKFTFRTEPQIGCNIIKA